MRNAHEIGFGLALLVSLGLLACDSAPNDGGATSKPTAKVADTAAKVAPSAKEEAAPQKVEMVEHDLSSAHEVWKGWVAQGPKDAKVMADGVKGARIAAKGPNLLERKPGGDNGFDLAFEPGKQDLKSLKTNMEKGAANPESQMKLTFLKDEEGMLEWTAEVGKAKTYNFVMHMQVDGKDYTCKNNYMMGSGNEAEHKRHLEACKTLKKK
ncbi:MAG: hypothetical protein JRI23_20720 [Deltaproteobacteria bacterium]|jgi:hypothetical protein|nr:hypothetical protein [Deltaproteobacteria bacterium]MBW2534328.1 hypothetical protein [Deltaproteobacteria bacterium]